MKRRPKTIDDVRAGCEDLMNLVRHVAGRRLFLILEFIVDDVIKPLEKENADLKRQLAELKAKPFTTIYKGPLT